MSETNAYLIALGSNMRSARFGSPNAIIGKALEFIANAGNTVSAVSPVVRSKPIGPSQREFANATAIVESALPPHAMLELLHAVELMFGRKRQGQRWRARVLDLDIILWSGGQIRDLALTVPHPRFRERDFVLGPARAVAGSWRDPLSGLSVSQLHARLTRPRPVPR